mmetsp:Transcript_101247/g.174854  ORF Transcript_101247/g.174854 Transcript_101247/m.174854 type:complete len:106 (-) Transcript_101247:462-779(-)
MSEIVVQFVLGKGRKDLLVYQWCCDTDIALAVVMQGKYFVLSDPLQGKLKKPETAKSEFCNNSLSVSRTTKTAEHIAHNITYIYKTDNLSYLFNRQPLHVKCEVC